MITTELIPLLISLIFLSIVVLWVAILNRKNILVLFVVIPLTLISATTSFLTVSNLLGYPTVDEIGDKSLYLFHITSNDEKNIFVWVFMSDNEGFEEQPRAISIPNTEENIEQMEKAKARSGNGIPQLVGQPQNGQRRKTDGEYITYDFQINGGALKDTN